MELVTRSGDRVPIVASKPVACRGGGRLVGRAIVLRDQREIVALQRQLLVSARLAAVGDLSKAIAESINEPIRRAREEFEGLSIDWQTIEHVLELAALEEDCQEAVEEGHELIGECIEGADRISSIVREVAGFSSENEAESFAPHAFDQIVRRAIRVARVQAPDGLEIEARLDPDVQVLCHFADLERVVTNLLVNSIHALDDRPPARATSGRGGRGAGRSRSAARRGQRLWHRYRVARSDLRSLLHDQARRQGDGARSRDLLSHREGARRRYPGLLVPGRGTSVAVELPRAAAVPAE